MKSGTEKAPIMGLDLSSPEFGISFQSQKLSQVRAAGLTTSQNVSTNTAGGERMPPPPPRPPMRVPSSEEDRPAVEAAIHASTSPQPLTNMHNMSTLPPQTKPTPLLAAPTNLHGLQSLIETMPHLFLPKLNSILTVVHHVLIIQQMREMVQVIQRLDIPNMAVMTTTVTKKIMKRMAKVLMQRLPLDSSSSAPAEKRDHRLTAAEAHAIKEVLKVLDGSCFFDHDDADQTSSGLEAVTALREAVFGTSHELRDPAGLLGAMHMGSSMDKVKAFHLGCLWLLKLSIRPSNCLRLMRLGQIIALPALEEEAFLYSLANLKLVLEGPGVEEWMQLDADDVVELLSNRHLKLPGALDAFQALSKWACYSLPDRQSLVVDMLSKCLQLHDMDLLLLQQLRQMQLVISCPEASALVSAAYTRRMVSSVNLSSFEVDQQRVVRQEAGGGGLMDSGPSFAMWQQGPSLPPLSISPDEEQLLKRPRMTQEDAAAAAVGAEIVNMVDQMLDQEMESHAAAQAGGPCN
ncbi:hypothetical protein CEUSTIGMA_g11204.t1 [Chlamydomonas eustigma]|uniref:BACK domain-containing protein n=1 Tax=Chlamydomonas eustigma TaxID=1157962 RepID=A0A250XLH1_9CHLO|nr:hypothetical protein CEUSTIGMA_g11204.t1 [Chlamydomonas eustigma]|eukprot:GAX83779.1 hypothetical protein CEUSTIGMA_g11204.t1 [Chlamydomonas eustigma]